MTGRPVEYSHAIVCGMFAVEEKPKDKKAYAWRDARGPMVGRFDKKIQDHRDDDNESAELQK